MGRHWPPVSPVQSGDLVSPPGLDWSLEASSSKAVPGEHRYELLTASSASLLEDKQALAARSVIMKAGGNLVGSISVLIQALEACSWWQLNGSHWR